MRINKVIMEDERSVCGEMDLSVNTHTSLYVHTGLKAGGTQERLMMLRIKRSHAVLWTPTVFTTLCVLVLVSVPQIF